MSGSGDVVEKIDKVVIFMKYVFWWERRKVKK